MKRYLLVVVFALGCAGTLGNGGLGDDATALLDYEYAVDFYTGACTRDMLWAQDVPATDTNVEIVWEWCEDSVRGLEKRHSV